MSHSDAACPSVSPPSQQVLVPNQGKHPTRAYGVLLDAERIHYWGTQLYNKVFPGELERMSPEKAREAVFDIRGATVAEFPRLVYDAFPNIPRLRRNLILMDDLEYMWLLVLKDNSTYSCRHAYLDPEDVIGIKKLLGLRRQAAKWHHVSGYD
ncbi:hypothetical protein K466DRAFT_659114 [Polyporus arcularius HHB13444]|uniref:Uncharacterized protein n=1 Tax=Polyporus arcularius HHB13444 TaxID=1314778 RepID=A0A5C3PSR6_9APHY|nr:hypothetical protein K466DRAFT_659114 [Polyporus arcularius HHB13444]